MHGRVRGRSGEGKAALWVKPFCLARGSITIEGEGRKLAGKGAGGWRGLEEARREGEGLVLAGERKQREEGEGKGNRGREKGERERRVEEDKVDGPSLRLKDGKKESKEIIKR